MILARFSSISLFALLKKVLMLCWEVMRDNIGGQITVVKYAKKKYAFKKTFYNTETLPI